MLPVTSEVDRRFRYPGCLTSAVCPCQCRVCVYLGGRCSFPRCGDTGSGLPWHQLASLLCQDTPSVV